MKKHLFLLLALLSGSLAASAQYPMLIEGNTFNVELDDQTMTATISDHTYKIDDAKYPLGKHTRKFKGLNGKSGPRTVFIPDSYHTASGKVYTITGIGRAAFADYNNWDYVVIPSTVTAIDDYAFFRTSLIAVEVPASVQRIGNRVFGRCEKLRSLKLPQGVLYGSDLYSESKEVDVKFYADDNLDVTHTEPLAQPSSSSSPTTVVRRPEVKATSDVDVDVPRSSKVNDEMFAVIIANEHYKQVPHVDYAIRDGESFRNYCEQLLGIPAENILMITDASKDEMEEVVDKIKRVAGEYDGDARIIVYYAGHGIPDPHGEHSAYLLPIGIAGDNIASSYSLNALYATLGSINAKSVTVFLDACFSGRRGDNMLVAGRGVGLKAKEEKPEGSMVVFSAAQGSETAYPYNEQGHGYFTYFLLKKLKETGGKATFGELNEYINRNVKRKTAMAKTPQHPNVSFSPQMSHTWKDLRLK